MEYGQKHSTLEAESRKAELDEAKKEFGLYLKELRSTIKHHSLRSLGSVLGVSANYLSLIEKGEYLPEDAMIHNIAVEFGIDEIKLFKIARRVPYMVRLEIEANEQLMDIVSRLVEASQSQLDEIVEILR